MGVWNYILGWFQEKKERSEFINAFNSSAKMAFVSGSSDILLRASVSFGNSSYRHAFSRRWQGGFRIRAEGGGALTRNDVKSIGEIIIHDDTAVRLMISLGWDTLEVYPSGSSSGIQWQLYKQIYLGN